jgi:hypothetical protein
VNATAAQIAQLQAETLCATSRKVLLKTILLEKPPKKKNLLKNLSSKISFNYGNSLLK